MGFSKVLDKVRSNEILLLTYSHMLNLPVFFYFTSCVQFPEECSHECSRDRDYAGISYRAFSRPESPFHMFYPADVTLNGMKFTSAGQYMLFKQAGKRRIICIC